MNSQRATILISMALAVIIFFNIWGREAAAETDLAWGPYPAHLVSRNHYLFWSAASETPILKTPICGGETTALATYMRVPGNLAINGQYILWIEERPGSSPSGSCIGAGGQNWILNKSSMDGTSKIELARGDNCSGGTNDIVVDETDVYWVNSTATPNEYFIKKVPIAGGDSITLVSTQFISIDALTGDANHIYWVENDTPPAPSTIKRMLKTGGQVEILYNGSKLISGGLAIHDGEIFFSECNYTGGDWYALMKVSVSGGSPITLATFTRVGFEPARRVRAITVDNENLYWIDNINVNAVPVDGGSTITLASILLYEAVDITVNDGHIFWTESTGPGVGNTGTLKSVSASGGEATTLVQGGDPPRMLALYNSDIYWSEGGHFATEGGVGRIAKIPTAGGTARTVISGVARNSPPIATDGRYLYIGDKYTIKKISISGGKIEKLHGAQDEIADLTTDGANVY